MRLRKLTAMTAVAIALPALAAIAPASQASASSCKHTSNYIFYMEVCPGIPNGGTVIYYQWVDDEPGHFLVWNHDNTSESKNSSEKSPWRYDIDHTGKLPYWSYTCGQFEAYQGNNRWAPVGPISCVKL